MIHMTSDETQQKGWFLGPWNSSIPVPIGYANTGVDLKHYHEKMYEVYLVAKGQSTVTVGSETLTIQAGQILVVEPGEIHTFTDSSDDYLHFVIQVPFVQGDKHLV